MEFNQKVEALFQARVAKRNGSAKSEFNGLQEIALKDFLANGLPTPKDEDWKYTNLKNLNGHAELLLEAEAKFSGEKQTDVIYIECHNGHYSAPENLPAGLEINICPTSDLDTQTINHFFGSWSDVEERSLSNLNTALIQNILHIKVVASQEIKARIELIIKTDNNVLSQHRVLVELEKNAGLTLVERYTDSGENSWTNGVTQIYQAQDSRLNYYKLQINDAVSHMGVSSCKQEKQSVFSAYSFAWSDGFIRNELNSIHLEEHCLTNYYGLYALEGNQFVDNHTLVDHAMPNCESNEIYKGILDEKSKAVFNGKVMVRQDAQKTNAYQSNKNILLADTATINAKPQLEIFADDVKCSHGATVGQLNPDELFYLRSRGLQKDKARQILLYAFAGEVVNKIANEELHLEIETGLLKKLGAESIFSE